MLGESEQGEKLPSPRVLNLKEKEGVNPTIEDSHFYGVELSPKTSPDRKTACFDGKRQQRGITFGHKDGGDAARERLSLLSRYRDSKLQISEVPEERVIPEPKSCMDRPSVSDLTINEPENSVFKIVQKQKQMLDSRFS